MDIFKSMSLLLVFIIKSILQMSFTDILKYAVEYNTWNITCTLQHLQV